MPLVHEQISVLSLDDLLQKVRASIARVTKIQGDIEQISLQIRAVNQEVDDALAINQELDDALTALCAENIIQDEDVSTDARILAKYVMPACCPL